MGRTSQRAPSPAHELLLRHPFAQILLGIGTAALLQYNWLLLRRAASLNWNDFGKFFYATQNWWAGASLYAPTVATHMSVGSIWMQFLDMNPPHFHLLLLPLLPWSLNAAGVLWVTINAAAATAACAVVVRELELRISAWQILPLLCLCLLSVATGGNALTAQCTGLLMLPMTFAWRAARHDRWDACGVWLGLLVSVKPFLGLFLPMLMLLGQWRSLALLCATSLVCFAGGFLVFGWSSYVEWLAALGDVSWVWAGMNGSLMALVAKNLEPSPHLTPLAVRSSLVTPLWIAGSLAVGVLSIRTVRRSIDHAFGVTVLAALLISPLGWVYYLWLALPGCLALWRSSIPGISKLGLALLCVPLFSSAWGQPSVLATLTVGCAYVWGTLALWWGLVTDNHVHSLAFDGHRALFDYRPPGVEHAKS